MYKSIRFSEEEVVGVLVLMASRLLRGETNGAVQLNNQSYGSLTIAVVPEAPSFDSEGQSSDSPTKSPRVSRVSVPRISRANLLAVPTGLRSWASFLGQSPRSSPPAAAAVQTSPPSD